MGISQQDKERMRQACEIALCSKEVVKVGCIVSINLIDTEKWGEHNHTPRGQCNTGIDGCKHAEARALMLGDYFEDEENATLYSTKAVCYYCATCIVQANIKRVVCPEPYEINPNTGKPSKWYQTQLDGLTYLRNNNVTVDFMAITMINGVPHLTEDLENAQ